MKLGYCDVCGQRKELFPFKNLRVCKWDIDRVPQGLYPTEYKKERIHATRPQQNNTSGSPMVDTEVMAYVFYLASSQDNLILTANGHDLTVNEPL